MPFLAIKQKGKEEPSLFLFLLLLFFTVYLLKGEAMSQLFYHMIYQEKTKRWLMMLDQFATNQTMTVKDLATKLSCTQRTVQSNIKQIKKYFDASILLLGGEDGYHFSFRSPTAYIRKKQALLDQEPLFFYADQLVAGIRKTNQEWAETLNLSPASFGRISHERSNVVCLSTIPEEKEIKEALKMIDW